MTERLVRPEARALLAGASVSTARVLILGAGGWFGSTVLELLDGLLPPGALMAQTGTPRQLRLGSRSWQLGGSDSQAIEAFAPTVVVNCAFLTRDRVADLGVERYTAENTALSARFLAALALPSVQAAVTVSSGAAVPNGNGAPDLGENPYGYLKWVEEVLARRVAAGCGVALVVCRAWSVSGALVNRPRDYAFSDLVLQAVGGRLEIHAAGEVWRRFVGADDLLAVSVALALQGWSGEVESGGPLVELGELAELIAAELHPGAPIARRETDDGRSDRYHSNGRSWEEACGRLGFTPATLPEQIRATAAGIASR